MWFCLHWIFIHCTTFFLPTHPSIVNQASFMVLSIFTTCLFLQWYNLYSTRIRKVCWFWENEWKFSARKIQWITGCWSQASKGKLSCTTLSPQHLWGFSNRPPQMWKILRFLVSPPQIQPWTPQHPINLYINSLGNTICSFMLYLTVENTSPLTIIWSHR